MLLLHEYLSRNTPPRLCPSRGFRHSLIRANRRIVFQIRCRGEFEAFVGLDADERTPRFLANSPSVARSPNIRGARSAGWLARNPLRPPIAGLRQPKPSSGRAGSHLRMQSGCRCQTPKGKQIAATVLSSLGRKFPAGASGYRGMSDWSQGRVRTLSRCFLRPSIAPSMNCTWSALASGKVSRGSIPAGRSGSQIIVPSRSTNACFIVIAYAGFA